MLFRHFHPVLSGAAERFRRYAPGLRNRGIEVTVITSGSRESGGVNDPAGQPGSGYSLHRIDAGSASRSGIDSALLDEAQRFVASRQEGDGFLPVLQCMSYSSPLRGRLMGIHKSVAARLFVGTMVEPEPPGHLSLIGSIKRKLRYLVFRRCFDHFVASTGVMSEQFRLQGIASSKIDVIPNGVDTVRFRPPEDESEKRHIREELGLPAATKVALFVGNIMPRKGVDMQIDAWLRVLESHPDATLVLAGPLERPTLVDPAKIERLKGYQDALFETCGDRLDRTIRFVGESERIQDYYKAADLFLFPSRKEGMGNVILEAMAAGLPVIMTNFIGRPESEFGTPGSEYVLSGSDPGEFADEIKTLLRNPEYARELGAAARRWALDNLDLELTLDRYAALYHRLSAPALT